MRDLPERWTVVIFTARESAPVLAACVRAALLACRGRRFVIDILVNGNRALAEAGASLLAGLDGVGPDDLLRLWHVPLGDKAGAWNHYVHRLWPGADTAFFIDGYVEVAPDALLRLHRALLAAPAALAASGVPTAGRSAGALRRGMLEHGGIHGNLYALPAAAMAAMRDAPFRLPLGLYRTDALIGAALMYRLAPARHLWDNLNIVVDAGATWSVRQAPAWSPGVLREQFRRRLRQAQGALENRAARDHLSVRRLAPALLAATAAELVAAWIAARPAAARRLFLLQPLAWLAARRLRQPRDWSAAQRPPELLATQPEKPVIFL